MTSQEELSRAINVCRTVAVIDIVAAFLCAANGDSHFIFFAVLGCLMWAMATKFKQKNDEIGE